MTNLVFSRDVLTLDLEEKTALLSQRLRDVVLHQLKRRGFVVAVSGGIDSACCLALAVRAVGAERVFALLLPERDSSADSSRLGRALCERFGVAHEVVDIAPVLEALGCYRMRDDAVRSVFPAFQSHMPWKIVLQGDRLASAQLNFFSVVIDADGIEQRLRLGHRAYLDIVAATNLKQRVRKMLEYTHADRLHHAVVGTPNRLEYDQGFFVKLGDGAADVKPIASLYKTQVYALARHLGVIPEILARRPTTDTYSLEQSQEDFYFSVDHARLDLILWAKNNDVSVAACAVVLDLAPEQVRRVYDDIDQKRRTTAQLHAPAILLERIKEVPVALTSI